MNVNITALLAQHPDAIMHVKRPTERMWIKVLKQDGMLLKYAVHQSWWMQYTSVKANAFAIGYCNNQPHELCLLAVTLNPLAYDLIRYPTQAVRSRALALRPATFFNLMSSPTKEDWRVFLTNASNWDVCMCLVRKGGVFSAEERRWIIAKHPNKVLQLANRTPDDECFAIQQRPAEFFRIAAQCSEQATWYALHINPPNLFFCPAPTIAMCYFVGPDLTAMRFGLLDLLMMFFDRGMYFATLQEKNVWVQIFLTMINQ